AGVYTSPLQNSSMTGRASGGPSTRSSTSFPRARTSRVRNGQHSASAAASSRSSASDTSSPPKRTVTPAASASIASALGPSLPSHRVRCARSAAGSEHASGGRFSFTPTPCTFKPTRSQGAPRRRPLHPHQVDREPAPDPVRRTVGDRLLELLVVEHNHLLHAPLVPDQPSERRAPGGDHVERTPVALLEPAGEPPDEATRRVCGRLRRGHLAERVKRLDEA